jgi:hypothetical protein
VAPFPDTNEPLLVDDKTTPEYIAWYGMHRRCNATEGRYHQLYVLRGITVCERWCGSQGLQNFLADMGTKPSAKHSLDRIDNGKGYSPENCRWATQSQQIRNSRRARYITFAGRTLTLMDWAKEVGIDYTALIRRIDRWGVERALTTPVETKFRNGNAKVRTACA